jgi:hypothetical protein
VTVTAEIRSALMGAIFPDHFPKASRSIIESRRNPPGCLVTATVS